MSERLLIDCGVLLESQQFLQEQVGTHWPGTWSGGKGKKQKAAKKMCLCACVPILNFYFISILRVGQWGFLRGFGVFFKALPGEGIVPAHGCQCSCHDLCERR